MNEPEHKFEYELVDDEGRAVPVTPDLEINDHEKARGMAGMLEWCKRVAERMDQWGFLADGGCSSASKVKISLMVFEDGEWQPMMEMGMTMGNDGFVRIEGKFPITIT